MLLRRIFLLVAALTVLLAAADSARAEFRIEAFDGEVVHRNGDPATQAGMHPDFATTWFDLGPTTADPSLGVLVPEEQMRHIRAELPEGLVGNPLVVPTCTRSQLLIGANNGGQCPLEAQVGLARLTLGNGMAWVPMYNMEPTPGSAATFGFNINGTPVILLATVRNGGDYGIDIESRNINQAAAVFGVAVQIWGVPADPANDPYRWGHEYTPSGEHVRLWACLSQDLSEQPVSVADDCHVSLPQHAFLTNPTSCTPAGVGLETTLHALSWRGTRDSASFFTHLPPKYPAPPEQWGPQIGPDGCDTVPFDPSVAVELDADDPGAPAGMSIDLSFPSAGILNPEALATSHLRKAKVTLPEGMTINPAAADGLRACTDAEMGFDNGDRVRCPNASRIGDVTVTTPVLAEQLSGGVYVGSQLSNDPESGKLFRLFMLIENEDRGIRVKLPGELSVDASTGRIEATFDNNPQLPVGDIRVEFTGGPRAALSTPPSCGTHHVTSELTSWSGKVVEVASPFTIAGTSGESCHAHGFKPRFSAGMEDPGAGESSVFALAVSREDGEREVKTIESVRLPEGLLGNVGSVPLCPEAQAAAGTCPESARVGHIQAALGYGASPLWVPQAGKAPTAVYLAGPYRGAPYSLSIVVPAQAGPFDLGTVVVRSALHVDERTAAITTGIDEARLIDPDGTVTEVLPEALPRILKGIVLNQREIRVIVDRDGFMVNPTDCSPMQVTAEIHSFGGDRVPVGNRFRAVECANLGFAPRFRARIMNKGRRSTLRSFHPRTRFTVMPRKGDANIGAARVVLPSSTILDQSNIGTTCTRAQMAERDCPAESVVGFARAWSPLLGRVVQGPVHLAANGGVRPLPDLAAVLDGEIRVVLQGEISTLRRAGKARLQNTFRVVPDAPVTRIVLTMRGGANSGLLVNSTDLCRTRERGSAVFVGQNGKRHRLRPRIATAFKGCGKVRRQAARRKAG